MRKRTPIWILITLTIFLISPSLMAQPGAGIGGNRPQLPPDAIPNMDQGGETMGVTDGSTVEGTPTKVPGTSPTTVAGTPTREQARRRAIKAFRRIKALNPDTDFRFFPKVCRFGVQRANGERYMTKLLQVKKAKVRRRSQNKLYYLKVECRPGNKCVFKKRKKRKPHHQGRRGAYYAKNKRSGKKALAFARAFRKMTNQCRISKGKPAINLN